MVTLVAVSIPFLSVLVSFEVRLMKVLWSDKKQHLADSSYSKKCKAAEDYDQFMYQLFFPLPAVT